MQRRVLLHQHGKVLHKRLLHSHYCTFTPLRLYSDGQSSAMRSCMDMTRLAWLFPVSRSVWNMCRILPSRPGGEGFLCSRSRNVDIYSTSAKVYTHTSFYTKTRDLHNCIRTKRLSRKTLQISSIVELYSISNSINSEDYNRYVVS